MPLPSDTLLWEAGRNANHEVVCVKCRCKVDVVGPLASECFNQGDNAVCFIPEGIGQSGIQWRKSFVVVGLRKAVVFHLVKLVFNGKENRVLGTEKLELRDPDIRPAEVDREALVLSVGGEPDSFFLSDHVYFDWLSNA